MKLQNTTKDCKPALSARSLAQNVALLGLCLCSSSSVFAQSSAEAEAYSEQSGTELTQNGKAVGYINPGDYFGFIDYKLPDEFDAIEIDLAVPASENDADDRIILRLGGPEGLALAYLTPSATGGWSQFESQRFGPGALDVYAGSTSKLYFTFEGSGFIGDIDAFRFYKEAEKFDDQSDTQLTQNGNAVGYIKAGSYFGYTDFTLPESFDTIEINLAVPERQVSPDDRIILTIGGPFGLKLAYLQPQATGGWNDFQKQQFNVGALSAYAGTTGDFYFSFEGTDFIADIESFRFLTSE